MLSTWAAMSCHNSAAHVGLRLHYQLVCLHCCGHPHMTLATIHESIQRESTGHLYHPAGWLSLLQTAKK